MAVNQREIVELNFELPNGQFKTHPALIISNSDVFETEGIFYALMISTKPLPDEFSFELIDYMVTKPLSKKSYIKCQLLQAYTEDEILRRLGMIKHQYFEEIKEYLFKTVF